jgi:hypothetical protein
MTFISELTGTKAQQRRACDFLHNRFCIAQFYATLCEKKSSARKKDKMFVAAGTVTLRV